MCITANKTIILSLNFTAPMVKSIKDWIKYSAVLKSKDIAWEYEQHS